MKIAVLSCDRCARCSTPMKYLQMTVLSCGHTLCEFEKPQKTERGEILCPRGCGPVYIREVI